MARPLEDFCTPVGVLLTDLDGTLTTGDMLESDTVAALEGVAAAGIDLILVTGRPSGWGQALMQLLPFRAAVTENGGLSFVSGPSGVQRLFALPEDSLSAQRAVMESLVAEMQQGNPRLLLSQDSPYRLVDMAVDWAENSRLPAEEADRITAFLRERGMLASRSSVHVNFSPPGFDKSSASQAVLRELYGNSFSLERCAFVGDSVNDETMFRDFPHSFGVKNLKSRWTELKHYPTYLCSQEGGAGFRELTRRILENAQNAPG